MSALAWLNLIYILECVTHKIAPDLMDFCTYEFFHYETRLMQLKLQIPDFVIYKEKIMGNFTIVSGEN